LKEKYPELNANGHVIRMPTYGSRKFVKMEKRYSIASHAPYIAQSSRAFQKFMKEIIERHEIMTDVTSLTIECNS